MTRIFRAALLAGLTMLAVMVLPPVVHTTLAATCNCAGASASTEAASCNACVTSCRASGATMSSYNGTAGTSCLASGEVDPASAPSTEPAISGTPETPPAVQAADTSYCSSSDPLDRVKCSLFLFIADILNIIASFIGKVLVFLVDILISFASYNGFGTATVVTRGWVVVRDVVNMFFIVVLLVSAFATIIGYDEGNFHYKRVLPKLLLMAVLINFSRTLIQLLIDFSQVIMLTFVNAFASAGPGNLVSALKLDQVLAMAPPQGGGSAQSTGALIGTVDPVNIILALMLGIFLLSISLGVVIIMTAFLIVRIVGLWIALILSPLALFATALPGRLQKSLNAFTGKYWSRLTGALTGGPIMAFFLWLTFAVTQSSAGEAGGLSAAVNIHTNNSAVSFLTSIGNSQDIASFIVGITLMLMGLDAAVSAANELSHTLGSYAKKVSGASQALGRLAATAPFLGAYYGGRAIDRRLDISGKAATAAFAASSVVPGLRTLVRPSLVAAMGRNKKLDKAEAAEFQKGLENLSPKQRAIAAFATPNGVLATKGQKQAYAQQMTERAGEKNAKAMKEGLEKSYNVQMTRRHEEELKAQGLSGQKLADKMKEDESMIKNRASQFADRDVAQRQAFFLDKAKAAAESAGDSDAVKQIEDQLKKNPQLSIDDKARNKLAKKLVTDPKSLGDLSAQAKGDAATLLSLIDASGKNVIQRHPDGKITGFDRAQTDAFMDKISDKDVKENMEMLMKLINESPSQYSDKDIGNLVIGKNEGGKKRILKLPVNSAGKVPQLAAELSRGASIRATGPEAILGTPADAALEPIISEAAKSAKTALKNAKDVVGPNPTQTNLDALRSAVMESVRYNGLKDTIDKEDLSGAVVQQFVKEMKDKMSNQDFTTVSALGKDIKGMSGAQQEKLLADLSDTFENDYIALRQAGKSNKKIDENMKNLLEVAANIKNEIEASGQTPSVGSERDKISKMVESIRTRLNNPDDKERKKLPSALKVIVESDESH
jgi:hypothetical protein